MAEEIIQRAEEAIRRGDLTTAVAAKKALGCVISLEQRYDLMPKYEELHAGIGDLISKTGTLN